MLKLFDERSFVSGRWLCAINGELGRFAPFNETKQDSNSCLGFEGAWNEIKVCQNTVRRYDSAVIIGTCTFMTPECTYTLTGSNEEVKVSGSVAGSGSTPLKETALGYFEAGTCN